MLSGHIHKENGDKLTQSEVKWQGGKLLHQVTFYTEATGP